MKSKLTSWFMRERGLVPKALFEEKNIQAILKDTASESSTYYQAILQNLFFATLSTKKEERQFRSEIRGHKGYNSDFGNQYVYRYHGFFTSSEKIKDYFDNIPFLNGGLFECLDDGRNDIYIDGFTERKKEYQPEVPNFLFFSGEKRADLNSYYGTKNKSYKVRGLLNTLSSFNFTIDENSPDDADIALDPELLGRVFENLLASFNPETSTTARKATGSYYTPREIVDYMVTESLKEYFKTHLSEIKNIDEKLENLFSTGSDENPFNKPESKKLVELIESVRIVDPAVGSGAFPMGMLNKMVFILGKIDPGNELWKQAQLDAAETIPDQSLKVRTLKEIEEYFKTKKPDYWRKLYLIQKCIYGVDIQQIAVEIAKLRFFISLLVDEDENDIQPLPNLDFKIMQGHSLLELISYTKTNDHERNEIVDNIKALKDRLFSTSDPKEKKDKRQEIDKLLIKLFEYDRAREIDSLKQKIWSIKSQKRLFEDEKDKKEDRRKVEEIEFGVREIENIKIPGPTEHFEWHINFSEVFHEKKGFDVVIANPPYVEHKKLKAISGQLKRHFSTYAGTADLYVYFYERGITILKNGGVLTYISSNKFIKTSYGEKLRGLLSSLAIKQLIDFTKIHVFDALVASCVIILLKDKTGSKVFVTDVGDKFTSQASLTDYIERNHRQISSEFLNSDIWQLGDDKKLEIKEKIEIKSEKLGEIDGVNIYRGITTGYNPAFLIGEDTKRELIRIDKENVEIIKSLLQGRNIKRWFYNKSTRYLLQTGFDRNIKSDFPTLYSYLSRYERELKKRDDQGRNWWNLRACKYYADFEKEKIIWGLTADKWAFAYDNQKHYLPSNGYILTSRGNLAIKYLLVLLNSNLLKFYFGFIGIMTAGGAYTLKHETISSLPVKEISEKEQKPFIDLADKILAITESSDYLENSAKQAKVRDYEKQIDQLVYKLYGLTPDEIKIVEKS